MISHSVETPRGTGAFFLSLVSSPPDKGGIGVCAFACILIPSPFSPYCYRNFPQCYEIRQGEVEEYFTFFSALILSATPCSATLVET